MEKATFLNHIENHFGFQLNKSQLQFFFLENRYTVMTSPRRGGKSLIASMDALYTCTEPCKTVCLVIPSTQEAKLVQDYIIQVTASLEGLSIERVTIDAINFNNNSRIMFKKPNYAFLGYRLDKAIILEPDHIREDIQELIDYQLTPCLAVNANSQLKLIGTHRAGSCNLMAYIMNPYFEKIQMTYQQSHLKLTRAEREDYKINLGDTLYHLEILNEITPHVLSDMFERRRKQWL